MTADVDALNYPYIRVRSADWLKRTLLLFPHVVRMSPFENAPADDPDVREFTHHLGSRGPLLKSANLWAPHVEDAQHELIRQIDDLLTEKGDQFRQSLMQGRSRGMDGQTAGDLTVWERRLLGDKASFQIHKRKVLGELERYLLREGLAWEPDSRVSDGPDYIELRPRLGEAIMACLATACAESEGLQVVTEFPNLHGRLIGTPREAILTAVFQKTKKRLRKDQSRVVAEFLVYRRCNIAGLTASRIAALKSERDALAAFREKLESVD